METKYEITNITHPDNPNLRRIRVVRNIPLIGLKKGTLGGFVESDKNLSQIGNAWVYDDACVSHKARVYDDAQVYGNARVSDEARVFGDAWVYGNAQVSHKARVFGDAQVYGNAKVRGEHTTGKVKTLELGRHTITIDNDGSDVTMLSIGCMYKSLRWWTEHYETVGKKVSYTNEEINLYGLIITALHENENS